MIISTLGDITVLIEESIPIQFVFIPYKLKYLVSWNSNSYFIL